MSKPINVTNQDFETEVLKSSTPVLVDFWAPWCGPCQAMAPILEELAAKYEGKLKIAKLNTDVPENQGLAMEYQIQSIPNMKLFKDGKVVAEYIGYRPKEMFEGELQKEIA